MILRIFEAHMLRTYDAGTVLPGRCFLCERAFEAGESAWNTGMIYEPDHMGGKLFGNKMVCDQCTQVLAEAADYVPGHQYRSTAAELDKAYILARENQAGYEEKIAHIKEQKVDPDALAAKVAALLKPKPRSTKATGNGHTSIVHS